MMSVVLAAVLAAAMFYPASATTLTSLQMAVSTPAVHVPPRQVQHLDAYATPCL